MPTLQDLIAISTRSPEEFDDYLNSIYPTEPQNIGNTGLNTRVPTDVVPSSGELADFPSEAAANTTPLPELEGMLPGENVFLGDVPVNKTKPQGGAIPQPRNPPSVIPDASAGILPEAMPTGGGVAGLPVQSSGVVAAAPASTGAVSAPAIVSGMNTTPNYYIAGTPVNYGVATGGAAPAGTVTPSGNVTTGAAPVAGALGGGGTAPGASASGIISGLQGLGQAASGFIAAGAIPQPQMQVVNPALADFPFVPIQQKPAPMG